MSLFSQQNNGALFSKRVMGQPDTYVVANVDGGARGNPGPAGYGVVLKDHAGKKLASLNEFLGLQTNNFAEYQGLIAALEWTIGHEHKALKVISDSELMVKQIKGQYKVKSPGLIDLYHRAKELIGKLDWFSIQHVLRGENREADGLANAAMDKGMGRRVSSERVGAGNPRVGAVGNPRVGTANARVGAGDPRVGTGDPARAVERSSTPQEFNGVVRNGRIELLDGELPEGAQVQVRVKR
jgi:ribonuclease HI